MKTHSVEFENYKPDTVAEQIIDLFETWQNGKQKWMDRTKEVMEYIYATSTRETSNQQNPWSHTTVVPKLTQIHDNLGANYASALFGNRKDFFTFDPATQDEAVVSKRNAIEQYLHTKHAYSGFFEVMQRLLDDWVQTGNCFCRIEYVHETKPSATIPDGIETIYQGPKLFRISPWDITFDYTADSFDNAPKAFRSIQSRSQIFKDALDPKNQYDQAVVDKLREFSTFVMQIGRSETLKNIQRQYDGFNDVYDYFSSGKVELIDFIGDIYDPVTDTSYEHMLITVVDRRWVLRSIPLDDVQGYGFIYHSGWRRRPDNLWAMGPLENLVGMQYLINHLENARADAFDQMLRPDEVYVGAVETQEDGPVRRHYLDDGNGSVNYLRPDTTILNADLQIQMKEAQMEAYAGAPREAMGLRSPGEKTKFEVQTLANAASRLFQHKINDFERFVELIINGELVLATSYLQGTDFYKIFDDDFGVLEFESVTKDDLTVKGKLLARGASHYAETARLVQELSTFENILAASPGLAMHFPAQPRAQAWNEALGFSKYQLYQPFGTLDEQLKLAQLQRAAQTMDVENQAAAQGMQQGPPNG